MDKDGNEFFPRFKIHSNEISETMIASSGYVTQSTGFFSAWNFTFLYDFIEHFRDFLMNETHFEIA